MKIFCEDASRALDAKQLVQELVAEIIEGQTYVCTVLEIKDYGAIVQVLRNREGLLHISELAHAARSGSGPSLSAERPPQFGRYARAQVYRCRSH